ncbi:HipA family kinase [Robertmurraya korlensis]|uniref:HipA family kinase n=1 Tax=Robertmurraya korlensis TaxID=519977 RepID=UPI000826207C|nr:HipA family kinase [Robertmurraya korlensis]
MIKPVSYVKKLEGKSNTHLIKFDDGYDYAVKYFIAGFEKSLPNEWVAYCLARYLQLPIPYARIVEIPPDFSSQIPGFIESSSNFQFASRYIPGCSNGHEVSHMKEIVNEQQLASIILFDYWLSNGDRTKKNILLREEEDEKYHLWIIDHAECFGSYNWIGEEVEDLPVKILKSATHQLMAQFVKDESAFYEALKVIQTLPNFLIEEVISLIPEDWQVSEAEKKILSQYLIRRRKKILPHILKKYMAREYLPLHSAEKSKEEEEE